VRFLPLLAAALALGAPAIGQQTGLDRSAPDVLDAQPPSARVTGGPADLAIHSRDCREFPQSVVRRRIVDLAVQEWAYFGFAIVDQTDDGESAREPGPGPGRGRRRGAGGESPRTASSIAGYWAVTPDGPWIVDAQKALWQRSGDESARWRYAWSAAFVSWVICESGIASTDAFRRGVAHHTYIDQAIRARDVANARGAFRAFEAGERDIAPGDLLCTARRPAYQSLAERRPQMGEGARTHCDIVVKVDEPAARLFAIGGNVRGTVGLKAMPVARARGVLRVVAPPPDRGGRPIFAHLKLAETYAAADPFDASPAVRALGGGGPLPSAWGAAAGLVGRGARDSARGSPMARLTCFGRRTGGGSARHDAMGRAT
jgi:hypothetical protein